MKVVIVGGVAGGASAAARLRRLDETAEIVVIERSGYVSYANCGLPYYVGGAITDRDKLTLQTPESFLRRFNIDVRVNSEVVAIDRAAKQVTVRTVAEGAAVDNADSAEYTEYTESYDKLILSPGAKPAVPDLPGVDSDRLFTLRTVEDTFAIADFVDAHQPASAAVVGGGFIGIEMAENLAERGIAVTLFQRPSHVLPILDADMAAFVHNHLRAKGVQLRLGANVQEFTARADGATGIAVCEDAGTAAGAETAGGPSAAAPAAPAADAATQDFDMGVLAIGVVPESTLAREAGLELGVKGAIVVDEHMRTSDPDIYAVGDAVQVRHFATQQSAHIALAGPANRQGRIAADNICGLDSTYNGSLGSSVIKVFDLTVAATGLTVAAAQRAGLHANCVLLSPPSHATYYPGSSAMRFKLVFDQDTGRVLGAQAVGAEGVDKRIDVVATAMYANLTVHDLAQLDLCYAPPYSSAKDPVNMAGFMASNIADGLVRQVQWADAMHLPANTVLVDVRTQAEYDRGHIEGALHIPVDSLRENLDALPKDKQLYVHCQSGLRSYIACRILAQEGYDCANVAGGYVYYEAAHTVAQQRTANVGPCGQ